MVKNKEVTLHSLWEDLDDVPLDDEGRIEHEFHIWCKGTSRFDIETWFDATLPIPLSKWLEKGRPYFDESGQILKNRKLVISVSLCHGKAKIPTYARDGDAGLDLCSTEYVRILPGEFITVSTGVRIALEPGYEGQVRPKSGLARKYGVTVLNTPGTIDSGFRGEIGVILINHGKEPFEVRVGMKIAQLVIAEYQIARLISMPAEEFDQLKTERGSGGFGSTGI